jgi:hypothetical protein
MIQEVFYDSPKTALAIANCESRYRMVQSNHTQSYGRERSFGIFQIHEPDWDHVAKELGLDYKNDVRDNITMARYIYERSGWGAWSCYRQLAKK